MHRILWFIAGAAAAAVGGELLYRLLEAIDPDDDYAVLSPAPRRLVPPGP
jgi:hypothetical protein